MHGDEGSKEQRIRDHLRIAGRILGEAGSQVRISDLSAQDRNELNELTKLGDDLAGCLAMLTNRSRSRFTSNPIRAELPGDVQALNDTQAARPGPGLRDGQEQRDLVGRVPIHSGDCSPALERGHGEAPRGALKDSPYGSHYKQGGPEPLELIEAFGLPFHLGCVVKYVARYKLKNGVEDLHKARWYLDRYLSLPRS